jgi:hypothetical protein
MKIIIKGDAIKDIAALFDEDGRKKFRRQFQYAGTNDKVDFDISELSDEMLDKIQKYLIDLSKTDHKDARSAKMSGNQVQQWKDIKRDPDSKCANKLKNVVSVMKLYISSTKNKFLFRQLEDGNSVPYLVTNIEYHAPRDYSPANVKISLAAHNSFSSGGCWTGGRGDTGGSSINIGEEGYRGKTMGEILKVRGYYLETEKRMAEYEREMTRFMAIRGKEGIQVNAVGMALVSGERHWYGDSFRAVEKSGRAAKMVIDPKSLKSHASTADIPFWRDGEEEEQAELMDIPYHPFIDVFDLEDHVNMRSHVNNISAYKYDKNIGDKLVLGEETKELLEILVHHAADSFSDIISGKQGGSIVLLAGVPGVGKTLTAEIYSEVIGRPLYSVQSSQLGIHVKDLEDELKTVLARAERWGAILLIDEADVYVRSRGNDIEQNAIVGVFLRVLEYYRGVLFMTTNMRQPSTMLSFLV